ncbi:unnamed protein product [Mucor hiemalis]
MQTSQLKNLILASSALVRKNRVGAIGLAIALIFSFWVKRLIYPPKHLKHIPYISYYTFLKSLIKASTYVERSKQIHLPFMQKNRLSIYLVSRNDSSFFFHARLYNALQEPGHKGWEVVVANPEDAKKVFLKHGNVYRPLVYVCTTKALTELFPKSNLFSKGHDRTLLAKILGGPNIVFLNGHQWKMQRMVANPAFRRSMPVDLFGKLALDLFIAMEECGNQNLEMNEFMERYTLESIGRAGFDFHFNCLRNQSEGKWISIYHAIRDGFNDPLYFFLPWLDQKLLFLNPRRKELHGKLDEFKALINRVIEQKKKSIAEGDKKNDALAENEKDLLTLMIESEQREKAH